MKNKLDLIMVVVLIILCMLVGFVMAYGVKQVYHKHTQCEQIIEEKIRFRARLIPVKICVDDYTLIENGQKVPIRKSFKSTIDKIIDHYEEVPDNL